MGNSSDEFEKYLEQQELMWEVWYRVFLYDVMKAGQNPINARMYQEYFRKRAKRTPEDWYGYPEE